MPLQTQISEIINEIIKLKLTVPQTKLIKNKIQHLQQKMDEIKNLNN